MRLLSLTILFTASLTAGAPALPDVAGQRLSDKADVTLSELTAAGPALVLVAFSKDGGDRIRAMVRALRERHPGDELRLVNVAVIASVPGLFRGMARGSLRNDIPEKSHDKTLVVADDDQESALREALGVTGDDAAYAVAVDGARGVLGAVAVEKAEEHAAGLALAEKLVGQ